MTQILINLCLELADFIQRTFGKDGEVAGILRQNSRAVGFVFWFDAKAGKAAKARYLSGAKDAATIVRQGWHRPSDYLTPTINEIKPGVIEISAPIGEDDEKWNTFLFVLLAYLGHAVYV